MCWHCDSHVKVRATETEVFGALLAACHPLCVAFVSIAHFPFTFAFVDVVVDRSREPPLAPSREAVQREASTGWYASTRMAMCEMLPAQLPQQEHLPELRKEMQKDSNVHERGLIAPWPRQSGGGATPGSAARPASGPPVRPGSKPKGAAQALALARQQLAQAEASALSEECIRVLECKVLKEEAETRQAQPMGQRTDQARASFRRVVEAGEKALEALQMAQANLKQAQQEVIQAQTDLDKLMQEAPLPVMPVPQVNVSLVQTLEALTGIIENMWNPDAGQPPEHLPEAVATRLETVPVHDNACHGHLADAETFAPIVDEHPCALCWRRVSMDALCTRPTPLKAGRR